MLEPVIFVILISLPIHQHLFTDRFRSEFNLALMYSIQISIGHLSKDSHRKSLTCVVLILWIDYELIIQ